jgi:transcriptional regulator
MPMHIPSAFRQDNIDAMHDLMRSHPLGMLISQGAGGLVASQIPILIYGGEGERGTLRAHIARANPQWKDLADVSECLVVFQGEHGYVSPSWYVGKAEHHKVVPTWNYITVHAWGKPRITEDAAWLNRQLDDLTHSQEDRRQRPWSLSDAPEDYIAGMTRAIVGVEIPIDRLEGKWKLSQNRPEADRTGVIAGLRDAEDAHGNPPLADAVERLLRGSDELAG